MRRFTITISAADTAQEGYLLQTASKILSDLQSMGTGCHLVWAAPPWQIAMEGMAEDPAFITRQVCDIMDEKRGTIAIKTA